MFVQPSPAMHLQLQVSTTPLSCVPNQISNKRQRKPEKQSRMDKSETQATLDILYRAMTNKTKTQHRKPIKRSNTNLTQKAKNPGTREW